MGIIAYLQKRAEKWGTEWLAKRSLGIEQARVRAGAANGRFTFLPYVESVTSENATHRAAYRQMLREPTIKAAILDKILSVAALDMAVNPGDDRPEDHPPAEFGLYLMNKLTGGEFGLTGLPAFCETVILPGLIDGYSISEKTWHLDERGRHKGKLLLRLKAKDPTKHVQLEVDEFDNIVGVKGWGINAAECWEPHQFVIWRHLSVFSNPGGMSDLRAAYRAFWLKDTVWKLRAIYLEKYSAGPMLVGHYTDPGAQKDQLETGLDRAKASTWLTIPEAAQVEALNLATTQGESAFKSCIDDLDKEIFLGINGATLQAMTSGPGDPRGSSAIHKSTADIRKWHISACVCSIVNSQILPDATDLNFGEAVAVPELSLGGVDDGEMASSLAVDVGLNRDLRLKLSRKDLYKRYGRPEPLDEADTLEPAEQGPAGGGMPFTEDPDKFCGGPGSGKPGPCPSGGGDQPSGDQPATPSTSSSKAADRAAKAREMAARAKEAIAKAGAAGAAKAKQVGAAVGQAAGRKAQEMRATLPETLANASLGTVQDWMISDIVVSQSGVPGLSTAMNIGAWAAAKAIVAIKRRLGMSQSSEQFAEADMDAAIAHIKQLMAETAAAAGIDKPLPSDDEIRAMLQSRLDAPDEGDEAFEGDDQPVEDFCGGKGGKPGPDDTPADGQQLATTTAESWNARESAGEAIPDSEIDEVAAQLEGTGWLIYWDEAAGQWAASSVDDYDFGPDEGEVDADSAAMP